MRVNNEHIYHGAALTQIAEHPQFTAINVFKTPDGNSRSAFKINDDIAVYVKYATKSKPPHSEYQFAFSAEHLEELDRISKKVLNVHVALVCVGAKEICRLSYADLLGLLKSRRDAKGKDEEQYTILARLDKGKRFRVYVNAPGRKNRIAGEDLIVPRNDFPSKLFESGDE